MYVLDFPFWKKRGFLLHPRIFPTRRFPRVSGGFLERHEKRYPLFSSFGKPQKHAAGGGGGGAGLVPPRPTVSRPSGSGMKLPFAQRRQASEPSGPSASGGPRAEGRRAEGRRAEGRRQGEYFWVGGGRWGANPFGRGSKIGTQMAVAQRSGTKMAPW